jgi:Domain of unknown function (DUF3943)
MKKIYSLLVLSLVPILLQAQFKQERDNEISPDQITWSSLQLSKSDITRYSDLVPDTNKTAFPAVSKSTSPDSIKYNMYGDLRNDNPLYNPRKSIWRPIESIVMTNIVTNLLDHYVLGATYTHVGFASWGRNLKAGIPTGAGWEWDQDRFGMNFFMHPYSGSAFFNAARANGYNFYESAPFALFGSYMWKIFGETGVPERNDLIMTTLNGIYLGEIFYRLGSDILDDQATGPDRFFRELAVAVISPTRFFARLLDGDLTRLTPAEVYQKEPLNIRLIAGYHRVNEGTKIENGGSDNIFIDMILDYGNPFEKRTRKPFDYFRLRTDLNFGAGRKIVDNITGYGILFGSNVQVGNMEMLIGFFQHMNYFDNKTFELGDAAFGPGVVSKLQVAKNSSWLNSIHIGIVPFGGLSKSIGPDTTQRRDYSYVGGMEGKLESIYSISGWVDLTFVGYYWWLHTYVGEAGYGCIGLIKPRITFKIFDNISLGFEHQIYYSDRYPTNFAVVHSVRTEEKIFVQLFLEEFKFKR